MKNKYVSALDLIDLTNLIGNAIVNSEHQINHMQLSSNNYDFEKVWTEILEIQFCDLDAQHQNAVKIVCQHLIQALCEIEDNELIIDDAFIDDCISDNGEQQLEFDFDVRYE